MSTSLPQNTETSPPNNGGTWEYKILSQRDSLFSGRFDAVTITDVLNRLGAKGWRVVTVTSSGVNTMLGGNRDEILIFLERHKQQLTPISCTPPAPTRADEVPAYYLMMGGAEKGPFSLVQLRDLLSGGKIAETTAVRVDGSSSPMVLADILR